MNARRAVVFFGFALAVLAGGVAGADEADAYDRLRARGVLDVAVYEQFPPYSYEQGGKAAGIDVDLAAALAKSLGLALTVRFARAGEDMDDDLRNYIWRGSVLGGGVADLMMHVGADPEYVKRQRQVAIFAPYYHESVGVVVNPARIRNYSGPGQLQGHKVSVELGSIGDLGLSASYNGQLRESLVRLPSAGEAVRAFAKGEVDAVVAGRGELQGLLAQAGAAAPKIEPVQLPGLYRSGWDVGLAIKSDNLRLREALSAEMKKLAESGQLAAIFAAHGVELAPVAAP